MSGVRHAVASATVSATARQAGALQPSAAAGTVPSTRMKTKAGSCSSPSAFTTSRSGSRNTRNCSVRGPRNALASVSSAVTTKLTRPSEPRRPSRMRVAVGRIHELSLVYGSRTTDTRWNVVSHSSSGPRLGAERHQRQARRRVRRHGQGR